MALAPVGTAAGPGAPEDAEPAAVSLTADLLEAVLLLTPDLADLARASCVSKDMRTAAQRAALRVTDVHLSPLELDGSKSAGGSLLAAIAWALSGSSRCAGLRRLRLEDVEHEDGDTILQIVASRAFSVPLLELLSVARSRATTDVGTYLLLDAIDIDGRLPNLRLLDVSETAVSFDAVRTARAKAPLLQVQRIPTWCVSFQARSLSSESIERVRLFGGLLRLITA